MRGSYGRDMADPGHWDELYEAKGAKELSWTEHEPAVSLALLERFADPSLPLVDVGGGRSELVDRLLERGWTRLTVLDLSAAALEQVRARLGEQDAVELVVGDVTSFRPRRPQGAWHDRAVLHFLVDEADQQAYAARAAEALLPGAVAVIGCFAREGPERCSGLEVVRRSPEELAQLMAPAFELLVAEHHEHLTPWGASQPFSWAVLRRRPAEAG